MSNDEQPFRSHEGVLEAIVNKIDISEEMNNLARDRYEEIGHWLDRNESEIKKYNPEVSPHGSFLIGTVTRPINDSDDFDIDLICRLNSSKDYFSMFDLKEVVGDEIKKFVKFKNIKNKPINNRHCWTLEYKDRVNFHMDIVPSVPNISAFIELLAGKGINELARDKSVIEEAIAITDKEDNNYYEITNDWPISNPKGFALWFQSRQHRAIVEGKTVLFNEDKLNGNEIYAKVEDVPTHKVKTPLQKSIQLLKRHRDVMFDGDDEKPASIILTTLSAWVYDNEFTIKESLLKILANMEKKITKGNDGCYWIKNPINPTENFAKKWQETPAKADKFFKWLKQARNDFSLYLIGHSNYLEFPEKLRVALSKNTIDKVLPIEKILAGTSSVAPSITVISETANARKSISASGSVRNA